MRVASTSPTKEQYASSRTEVRKLPATVSARYLDHGSGTGRILKCFFRAGVLPHAARGGAWRTLPPQAQLCLRCHAGARETMDHVLLACPATRPVTGSMLQEIEAAVHVAHSRCTRACRLQHHDWQRIRDLWFDASPAQRLDILKGKPSGCSCLDDVVDRRVRQTLVALFPGIQRRRKFTNG